MSDDFEYGHDQKKSNTERVVEVIDSGKINYHQPTGNWYSYTHRHVFVPRSTEQKRDTEVDSIERPRTLKDVVALILRAEKEGLKVRAVGSGHSFSNVIHTTGVLVDTHLLDNQLTLPSEELKGNGERVGYRGKPVKLEHLVSFEAGITIREVNRHLDAAGLGLLNMGGYDGQTVIGAASTSTHGSGIDLPPFCDMILSLVLVSSGGKVYRIEPGNGITDPEKYKGAEGGVSAQLIQSDRFFHSVICSMGCMGIICSYVLQVRDQYFLREVNKVRNWDEVEAELTGSSGDAMIRSSRHFSVTVNPYVTDGLVDLNRGKRKCIVQTRDVFEPTADERKAMEKHTRNRESGISRGLARGVRFNKPDGVGRALNTTFDLELAKDYKDLSHEVFIAGGAGIGGYACEWSFPIAQTKEAFRAILEVIEAATKDGEQVQTGPIAIRYVNASKAYLSPQYGRDSVMFELLMIYGTPGKNAKTNRAAEYVLMHRYYQKLVKLGGRPHWGLEYNDFNVEDPDVKMETLYPQWDAWVSVYKHFNPTETFSNDFTDRLGLGAGHRRPDSA